MKKVKTVKVGLGVSESKIRKGIDKIYGKKCIECKTVQDRKEFEYFGDTHNKCATCFFSREF